MKPAKRSSVRQAANTRKKLAATHAPPPRAALSSETPATKPAATKKRFVRIRTKTVGPRKEARIEVPPILLEGDRPATRPLVPPTQPQTAHAEGLSTVQLSPALPEAYGTQRLKLTPRDPHWIHAHWDFTQEQLRVANSQSAEGRLVLRVFDQTATIPLVSETQVHPESVRWFVHVPKPNVPYTAEIGFYNRHRRWSTLATSNPVQTPPAGPSTDHHFELATLTTDGTVERHATIKEIHPPRLWIGENRPGEHATSSPGGRPSDLVNFSQSRPGSESFALSSPGVASWGSGGSPSSLSNPLGGMPSPSFRLEVNAELIIHGATEPDATLKIGEHTVPLEPDGAFSLRFSLPDGVHTLPVVATSARTGEQRTATLRFSRHTQAQDQVSAARLEPGLKPPSAENL